MSQIYFTLLLYTSFIHMFIFFTPHFFLRIIFFHFEAILSEIVLWKFFKICLRVFLFETMLILPSYWNESCAALSVIFSQLLLLSVSQ